MKKILLLFCLFISINSYCQNIHWYDVIIDVNGEDAESVIELVTEYYSNIDIPKDVSMSFSGIRMKGNSFKGTHWNLLKSYLEGIIFVDTIFRIIKN